MQFGKRTLFFALNGMVALVLLIYFLFWLVGNTATGTIQRPLQSNIVVVQYTAKGQWYSQSFMRSGISFSTKQVEVRYWPMDPSVARINSFMGLAAEPLAWWFVFLLASVMLLITNNTVFSKGTVFQLHKGFPWITMDEFFPEEAIPQEPIYEPKQKRPVVKKLQNKN